MPGPAPWVHRLLVASAVGIGTLWMQMARGQVPAGDGAGHVARDGASLQLVVEADEASVSADDLSSAISDELSVPVGERDTPGALGTVSVRSLSADEVRVVYVGADDRRIERTITLPEHPEQRALVVALLVGNFVRAQAEELLSELQAEQVKRRAEAQRGTSSEAEAAEAALPGKETASPETKSEFSDESSNGDRAPLERRSFNTAFFHPLALHPDAANYRFMFEFGVFYGVVGGVDGMQLELVAGRVARDLSGVSLSGVVSTIGGDVHGVAFGGVVQTAAGSVRGVQAGGIFTYADGHHGAQLGGLSTWSTGPSRGVQASGLANVRTAGDADGKHRGVQITGGVNVDTGELEGLQLGLINVGHRVSGAQVGFVNVAREVDGVSIAPVVVSGSGRTQIAIWASNAFVGNLGIQFTNGPLYTMPQIGVQPADGGPVVASGIALGVRVPLGSIRLDADGGIHHEASLDGNGNNDEVAVRYRAVLGWGATSDFEPFAGFSLRQRLPLNGFDISYLPEVLGGVALF